MSLDRMRADPNEPTALHISLFEFPNARGGSSTKVPPSDPLPTLAGVNDRYTCAVASGQSGSDDKSSVGSAASVSGTPATTTATSFELDPRIESVAKEASAPSRRTCTPGK